MKPLTMPCLPRHVCRPELSILSAKFIYGYNITNIVQSKFIWVDCSQILVHMKWGKIILFGEIIHGYHSDKHIDIYSALKFNYPLFIFRDDKMHFFTAESARNFAKQKKKYSWNRFFFAAKYGEFAVKHEEISRGNLIFRGEDR